MRMHLSLTEFSSLHLSFFLLLLVYLCFQFLRYDALFLFLTVFYCFYLLVHILFFISDAMSSSYRPLLFSFVYLSFSMTVYLLLPFSRDFACFITFTRFTCNDSY